ncbi:hypothetical protein [Hymenobacter yonginensis]|uniref:Uncharacterized protein n=1 Tax=Hymenobacter yonginensis TaxID=748197 RepID=A0ABY7PUI2_9BACT|nr:hypothetical protein [Hymenobacter yonginensis]WBO86285.1 hypothetical protein O9Z63_08480 [Hymenobacter yonginensis]
MAVTIRKNDVKASNLILLLVALTGLRALVGAATGQSSPYFTHWMVGGVYVLTLGLYVAIGLGVRAGKRWVKIAFLLYSLLNFYFITLPPLRLSALTVEELLRLLAQALHIWAFFLVARDLLRRPVAEQPQ